MTIYRLLLRTFEAFARKSRSEGIVSEHSFQGAGERGVVAGRERETVDAVEDELRYAAGGACHHRDATRLGLEDRQAERFGPRTR